MSLIQDNMELEEAWRVILDYLEQASQDPGHSFRYLTLATVDQENIPHQRMVVLRDFIDREIVTLYTDARSQKVGHIQNNISVSLHFYDYEEKLQVLLNGNARLIKSGKENLNLWRSSGSKGAHSYTSLKKPGKVIEKPKNAYSWDLDNPEHFCVINVHVQYMEFLKLRDTKHLRSKQLLKDGNWEKFWIAP